MSAAQNVPISEMSEPGNDNAAASVKPAAIAPKKRWYERCCADTIAESESARKKSTSKIKSILKNPVVEVNQELRIEGSENKPKNAIEKSRKSVTWADAPPGKKARHHVKKHPRKAKPKAKRPLKKCHRAVKKQPKIASAPQSTNEVLSTSGASEENIECVNILPLSALDTKFWMDILARDFDSPDYEKLLKRLDFTEEQAETLKRSLHLMCRKIHIATTYTDRFMKTHMCMDCEFTISHQCVSIHFKEYVQSNASAICITSIPPESVNMCTCGFGFFHSHASNSRTQLSDNLSSINISRMYENYRSITVGCFNCDMNIVMRNRNKNICGDFKSCTNLTPNRQFYNFLKERLELSSMSEPSINELTTCKKRCCQIFHRCPENAVPNDDKGPKDFQ